MNHKGVGVNRTALHYAIQNGHIPLAHLLLDHGADPNDAHVIEPDALDDPRLPRVLVPPPFCYAIELGHDSLVETMLSRRLCSAETCHGPGQRTRPLSLALQSTAMIDFQRRLRVLKLLLEHGARPQGDDLASALQWPTADALRELMPHVQDVNAAMAMPRKNWRLLHVLCSETPVGERMQKIKLLVSAGADLNVRDVVRRIRVRVS